jgi:hypothetical protein
MLRNGTCEILCTRFSVVGSREERSSNLSVVIETGTMDQNNDVWSIIQEKVRRLFTFSFVD